ncbi:MAG: type II toxin-antitoxin system HicB family antitoxin [Opitutales bacterium]|nr:type II toxin-antitoxin system HicB family antitoxin [Opitutales bacterium]
MNEYKYEVVVYWDKADRIFVADVPELPGCMAHGQTKTKAIQHAEAAIALWIQTARADGISVPEPRGRILHA